jgi:hypothetical protein
MLVEGGAEITINNRGRATSRARLLFNPLFLFYFVGFCLASNLTGLVSTSKGLVN